MNVGTAGSFTCDSPPSEKDGIIDGVGGSDSTLEEIETGKVKPELLLLISLLLLFVVIVLLNVNVVLESGLLMEIEAKRGLEVEEVVGGFFC